MCKATCNSCKLLEKQRTKLSRGDIMKREKQYLVSWIKNGISHNASVYAKSKKEAKEQMAWDNIKPSMINSIEEIKKENIE